MGVAWGVTSFLCLSDGLNKAGFLQKVSSTDGGKDGGWEDSFVIDPRKVNAEVLRNVFVRPFGVVCGAHLLHYCRSSSGIIPD